jgi:predicted DsbA family dithiol-disulfide isomerase
VKLVFRGIAFVGADSATALRTVLAAGARDRLWDVTHLIYANQGVENTGWITDAFLRSIVQAVPGLDPAQIARVAQSPQVAHEIAELQALANADGVDATPWFAVGRSGGRLARLQVRSLDARTFRPALDALLQA